MSTRLELIRETEEKTRDGGRRRIGGSCAHVTNTGSADISQPFGMAAL